MCLCVKYLNLFKGVAVYFSILTCRKNWTALFVNFTTSQIIIYHFMFFWCHRVTEPEEANAILETEQRLERIRQSLQQKESQELDQLRHRQAEAEQELEELNRRREERRRLREEEEHCREQEEQQRLAQEEVLH